MLTFTPAGPFGYVYGISSICYFCHYINPALHEEINVDLQCNMPFCNAFI